MSLRLLFFLKEKRFDIRRMAISILFFNVSALIYLYINSVPTCMHYFFLNFFVFLQAFINEIYLWIIQFLTCQNNDGNGIRNQIYTKQSRKGNC